MALYTRSFIGMLPVGSLVYGSIAHHIGSVQPVFIIAGIISVGYGYVLTKVMPDLRRLSKPVLGGAGDSK
jgi:hypothetical protein